MRSSFGVRLARVCFSNGRVGWQKSRYQYWPEVLHIMARNLQANVIVADWRDSGGSAAEAAKYGARWMPRCRLRLSLAIAATADVFIGFDSGPFYAAIGNLVRAVGIFPIKPADWLYWPVREPLSVPLEAFPCDAIPPRHIAWSALQLLAGAKPGEGIEQFEDYKPPVGNARNPR
jgi:hypothetical protein